MNHPDDEARVLAIKNLLDRIQQLPIILPEEPAPPANGAYQHQQQWVPEAQYAVAGAPAARTSSLSPWVFVLATALNTIVVAVLAVMITLGVVQHGTARSGDPTSISARVFPSADPRDAVSTSVFTTPSLPSTRLVEIAPIGSPTEPLRFEPRKAARFPLLIEPEEAAQESFILVLSGLPAGSELIGGRRIGSDSWLLPPNSIPKLELSLSEWSSAPLQAGIEMRRVDGSVAARTVAWIEVPPPESGKVARLDPAALKDLLQRGDQLLGRGDVVGARAVYERAAEMGSGPAALALASTYDPNRLWSLGVFGMVGNRERARHWYARADQLGHPSAKDRLRSLGE
jgi:hypothetical protein